MLGEPGTTIKASLPPSRRTKPHALVPTRLGSAGAFDYSTVGVGGSRFWRIWWGVTPPPWASSLIHATSLLPPR